MCIFLIHSPASKYIFTPIFLLRKFYILIIQYKKEIFFFKSILQFVLFSGWRSVVQSDILPDLLRRDSCDIFAKLPGGRGSKIVGLPEGGHAMPGAERVFPLSRDLLLVQFSGVERVQKAARDQGFVVHEPRRLGPGNCPALREALEQSFKKPQVSPSPLHPLGLAWKHFFKFVFIREFLCTTFNTMWCFECQNLPSDFKVKLYWRL